MQLTRTNYLSLERVDDELQLERVHALDALLHDVVAVLVLDALQHVAVELAHDLLLLLRRDGLERLLDHATAVHLERERQDVAADLLRERRLLLRRAELEELLDDVVAEHVRHEGVRADDDLVEHHLLLGRRGALQLLLDEARAVLVLRELDDVIGYVAQLQVRVAVVAEILEQTRPARHLVEPRADHAAGAVVRRLATRPADLGEQRAARPGAEQPARAHRAGRGRTVAELHLGAGRGGQHPAAEGADAEVQAGRGGAHVRRRSERAGRQAERAGRGGDRAEGAVVGRPLAAAVVADRRRERGRARAVERVAPALAVRHRQTERGRRADGAEGAAAEAEAVARLQPERAEVAAQSRARLHALQSAESRAARPVVRVRVRAGRAGGAVVQRLLLTVHGRLLLLLLLAGRAHLLALAAHEPHAARVGPVRVLQHHGRRRHEPHLPVHAAVHAPHHERAVLVVERRDCHLSHLVLARLRHGRVVGQAVRRQRAARLALLVRVHGARRRSLRDHPGRVHSPRRHPVILRHHGGVTWEH